MLHQKFNFVTQYFATMNANIKAKIDGLDPETRRRVLDTITALDNGKGQSVEFYADGSGACFTVWSPTINHGCPGTVARSFKMEEAVLILAGHRLKSHELPKCM